MTPKPQSQDVWSRMLERLEGFVRSHEHCRVPANYPEDPALGRWVAAQRYKRKVGDLAAARIKQMDRLGFVWMPSDETWTRMLRALQVFAKRHGHCSVPEHWPENQPLANWVQSQRHRRKRGKLSGDRCRQLEHVGFVWAVYKTPDTGAATSVPASADVEAPPMGERLYVIRHGLYAQFAGKGPVPKDLAAYVTAHRGEWPPYIPLPTRPTTFTLGDGYTREKRVKWSGKGIVPPDVVEYVKKNGTLPRYD